MDTISVLKERKNKYLYNLPAERLIIGL